MKIGAAELKPEKTTGAEFCVIGAGPAGLVVACELGRLGHEIVVLESGIRQGAGTDLQNGRDSGPQSIAGVAEDDEAQRLNEGDASAHTYAGLRATRHRGLGGSTLLWNSPVAGTVGAKYVPLDAWDYNRKWEHAQHGWPFVADEIEPFMRRAESLCGIASFADEAERVARASIPPLLADGRVEPRTYQLASQHTLIAPLVEELSNAPNVTLISGATALDVSERDSEAVVHAATSSNVRFTVSAKRVILAAGAVENARLLLLSAESRGWAGDRSSWLGCGFMEHPRDRSITLRPRSNAQYRALSFFDSNPVGASISGSSLPSAAMAIGRLGLARDAVERDDLLNASATLLPNVQPSRARIREIMVRRTGIHSFRRWLPESGHGWSRHENPASVFDGFTVLLNLEQSPRRENRIRLSSKRDRFGVPLPELTWHWHGDDADRLIRIREVFRTSLSRAEVGDVTMVPSSFPDPNAHHHAGTTRMHNDPREGVVDANGQVHGSRTLYVAGASVFPSAGFANPTLTIIAMALRLAKHLHAEVR